MTISIIEFFTPYIYIEVATVTMSSTVNNFFESIVNSTNPQYIGQVRESFAMTPGNMEAYHQSLPPLPSGQYNTSFMADRQAGSGSLFK